MISTTLEQSKKLVELGIDPSTADMYWFHVQNEDTGKDFWKLEAIQLAWRPFSMDTRAWSLSALLELMPDELEDNHFLTIEKEMGEYCCCYEDINGNSNHHCFAKNPIDACYEMILKLKEKGLL